MANSGFDTILEEVGYSGRWQWGRFIFLMLSVRSAFIYFPQFAELSAPHACRVQELETKTNWSFEEKLSFMSGKPLRCLDDTKDVKSCYMAKLNYSDIITDGISFGEAMLLIHGDGAKVFEEQYCNDGVIFDGGRATYLWSMPMEFQLVCNKAGLQPLANTLYMLGSFLGLIFSGLVSDRYGRRMCSIIFGWLTTIVALLVSASPNFVVYAGLRLLLAAFIARIVSNWVWLLEVMGPRKRGLMTIIAGLTEILCGLSYIGLAYYIQNWRILHLVVSIPTLLTPGYYWLFPESPRWLMTQKRFKEAAEVLKDMARTNNGNFSTTHFEEMVALETPNQEASNSATPNVKIKVNHAVLFRTPELRKRMLILLYMWFSACMVLYGFVFASVKLPGDAYLNAIVNASMGIPSLLVQHFLMHKLGRKRPLFVLQFCMTIFAAITAVLLATESSQIEYLANIASSLGKACVFMAILLLYLITPELLPTVCRTLGLSACNGVGRLGSAFAPYIVSGDSLWRALPSVIFASFGVFATFFGFLLPDTTNKQLPETIEDVENVENRKYSEGHEETEA